MRKTTLTARWGRSARRRSGLGIAALCLAALVVLPAGSAAAAPGSCRELDVSVPDDYTIHGELCLPSGRSPSTVLLGLHGITYTHLYWNSGYRPETYSFARYMTSAGYATFAIDRLGYGQSSHPPAELVTLDSQAATAHAIVQALRAGKVGGRRFDRVVLVGHSYGTATSWLESSQYNDADAVIGTGWGSTIQPHPLARFFSGFYPAQADPKFADKGLPPGYYTSMPGGRNQNFLYDLSNVEPAVIDYDQNVLRDTVADGEAASFYNRYGAITAGLYEPGTSDEALVPLSQHTKEIKIPVFTVNGRNELFFCGVDTKNCNSSAALQEAERPYFSKQACLRAAVIDNAGHNLNFQRNAQESYRTIREFADMAVGPGGEQARRYAGTCARP
jgi:pimeloyl-ACP methyl ester carboxylesterase